MVRMKAIVAEKPGEPDVLRYVEAERPSPGEGEVLIGVEAAGVNYADTMRRRDQYLTRQTFPSPRVRRWRARSSGWGRTSGTLRRATAS